MKTLLFLTLLTLAGCGTEAEKKAEPGMRFRPGDTITAGYDSAYNWGSAASLSDSVIIYGHTCPAITERDSLSRLLSSYKKADSINRSHYLKGNVYGWYSVNP